MKNTLVGAVALAVALSSTQAFAQDAAGEELAPPTPSASYPKVGGHLALALPIVQFGPNDTTVMGGDFTKFGLAPGVTVKLSDRWAIDFEMVAYSDFYGDATVSSLVIDPGVVYNFGFMAAGLRTAVHVGQVRNWGFIPIILKSFPLGNAPIKAFVEMDFPIFFDSAGVALTLQPQAGIAF